MGNSVKGMHSRYSFMDHVGICGLPSTKWSLHNMFAKPCERPEDEALPRIDQVLAHVLLFSQSALSHCHCLQAKPVLIEQRTKFA